MRIGLNQISSNTISIRKNANSDALPRTGLMTIRLKKMRIGLNRSQRKSHERALIFGRAAM